MREIEFLELSNFSKKKFFQEWINFIYAHTFIAFFLISIGLLFIPLSISILYGILIGLFSTWIGIVIFTTGLFFLNKLKSPKKRMWSIFFLFVTIRSLVFLTLFFVILLIVNDLNVNDSEEIKSFLKPINLFAFILSYQCLMYTFVLGSFFK